MAAHADISEKMASSDEEEREKHNSSENLEMAASRYSSDTRILVEDSIMTVSLQEDQGTEFMLDISQGKCRIRCHCLKRNLLPIVIILLMFVVSTTLIGISKAYQKSDIRKSVRNFLVIGRYGSICGFLGGISVVLSHLLIFSTRCGTSVFGLSKKEFATIEGILRRFVEGTIFEEIFVKQYVRRVISLEENSYSKTLLDVIDSREFDSMLHEKISEFMLTPEGFILGMFNFKEDNLFSYCKTHLVEAISLSYPMVVKRESNSELVRPETVRRHILAIISERFSGVDCKEYSKLLRNLTKRRRNLVTTTTAILMSLFGCCVGVLELYVFGS